MPDAKTITKDILKEKTLAAKTMKEMNDKQVRREDFDLDSIEYAIVVEDLQCWRSLCPKDIGPYNQHSVIVN